MNNFFCRIQINSFYSDEKSNSSDLDERNVHSKESEVLKEGNLSKNKLEPEITDENHNYVSDANELENQENKKRPP